CAVRLHRAANTLHCAVSRLLCPPFHSPDSAVLRVLHSFPTRRSSDLRPAGRGAQRCGAAVTASRNQVVIVVGCVIAVPTAPANAPAARAAAAWAGVCTRPSAASTLAEGSGPATSASRSRPGPGGLSHAAV